MSYFSNKLYQLRKESGMTQEQIAARLEISRSSVAMYESGDREPSFEMLECIADLFNINMRDLVGGANEQPAPQDGLSPAKQKLISRVQQMTDAQAEAFLRALDAFLSIE